MEKAAVRKRFDRWAPRYERNRRSRCNARAQEEGLAVLALEARDRFLDVGCGSGAAVRAAAVRARRAVGVDLAPAMIERAQALAEGQAGVEFLVGDAEALPFPAGSFEALLCSSSFHHYPDPARAVAELARVLAPGGRLALAEPSADLLLVRVADRVLRRFDGSHVRLYWRGELVELVTAAGFSSVGCRALDTRGYVLISGRRPADA
jgi:ubiquinone/menaquinone biosynthesis C-methylase UbiE